MVCVPCWASGRHIRCVRRGRFGSGGPAQGCGGFGRITRGGVDLRQWTGVVRNRNVRVDQYDRIQVERCLALDDPAWGVGNRDAILFWQRCGRGCLVGRVRGVGSRGFLFGRRVGFRLRSRFDRLGFWLWQRRAVFHEQAQPRIEGRAAHAALHPALRGVELVCAETEYAGAVRTGGAVIHRLTPARRTQPSSTTGAWKSNQSR